MRSRYIFLVLVTVTVSTPWATVAATETDVMERSCATEVVELHQFFQDWFNGAIAESEESFSRLQSSLSPGFELIGPEGRVHQREELLEALRSVYGKWRDEPGRIWIENIRHLDQRGERSLVSYEEWQQWGGETAVRLSTVLFGLDAAAPLGVSWLYLHETWVKP